MILPITLTMTAAATLLNIWLGSRVGRVRMAHKISMGDGGEPALVARMRAQANFIENTPFFLLLLGLIELAHGPATWLWIVAILFIVARILHAFGMDRPSPNKPRMIGILASWLILIGLSGYALSIPYLTPAGTVTTMVGPG